MKGNVLIDSYGWIEYFTDGQRAEKYSRYVEKADPKTHITPSIVLYEVYKKIKSAHNEEVALKAVAHIVATTSIVPVGQKTALHAAEISLKHGLAMADSLIKAAAQENAAIIVTSDPHFKGLADVVFIA